MKVYEYVEYGIYDYNEFCSTKVFLTKEKAQEYFKEKVEKEKSKIDSMNFYNITKDWENAGDGDFVISNDTDDCFCGYEYGYSNEYSINIEIREMECN